VDISELGPTDVGAAFLAMAELRRLESAATTTRPPSLASISSHHFSIDVRSTTTQNRSRPRRT